MDIAALLLDQGADAVPAVDALVAAVNFGVGLFKDANPQLVLVFVVVL